MSAPPVPPPKKSLPPTPGSPAQFASTDSKPSTPVPPPKRPASVSGPTSENSPSPSVSVDDDDEETPGYKVAAKVDLKKQLELDKEDESLNRWKQSLLGSAVKATSPSTSDGRQVIVEALIITFAGQPDIVLSLSTPALVEATSKTTIKMVEGATYTSRVKFRVQNEIVAGLKCVNSVYRMGIRVQRNKKMMGSFGPQSAPHVFEFEEDVVPDGFMKRGSYTAKCQFVDDDKQVHLDFEYMFEIVKDQS